jgi:hypothetical protein
MKLRYFFLCGMIAPVLFILTAILGGALRPGYSHIANTVSELFSPGSPNKPLLDAFHTIFAILLILFGVCGNISSRCLGLSSHISRPDAHQLDRHSGAALHCLDITVRYLVPAGQVIPRFQNLFIYHNWIGRFVSSYIHFDDGRPYHGID